MLILATTAEATTRRVDDDSTATTPNGLTWSNAYSDLQEAINDSMAGDTIWLAQGEYKPGGSSPTRSSTFELENGVDIEGGFNGLAVPGDEDTRVLDASLTILTGDLAGNDGSTIPPDPFADNSFVVVTAGDALNPVGSTTELRYVTIRGGNGENSGGTSNGGAGLTINIGSNPTLENCIIEGNRVPDELEGGGVLIKTANPDRIVNIENCIIRNNRGGKGGGIAVLNGSRLVMTGNQSAGCHADPNELIQ